MITIKIDTFDRSSLVEFGSIAKRDEINSRTDTLNFNIIYHPGQVFRPETNSEVEMWDGATKVFAGRIYAITKTDTNKGMAKYQVKCKDYAYDLDRLLVNEGYEDATVDEIIAGVIDDYAPGFTYANVDCPLPVEKISFDRITASEVLQRLSDMTGYSWYVDYDKDIHFFEKNNEPAPFNLTDDDGNYIPESLEASEDFSQIRNRVFIKGGEIEGEARPEVFDGDGEKKQFKLSNKFAGVPTVEVDSVAQDVGVDYIDNEDDFDCFWDFNQQYIRFKDDTIPGIGANNIEVVGIPLYNLVVQVEDPASIAEYGVFEFSKINKTIKSRDVAVAMAKTEIEAYRNGLIEGQFETYTTGMRSGQIININSTLLDIDEDFLIQSVSYRQLTIDQGIWSVKLATLRTIGIIDFLIGLLKQGSQLIEDQGEVVLEKTIFKTETITISDEIDINTDDIPITETLNIDEDVTVQALNYDVEFCWGPQVPSTTKRVFIFDGSPLA